MTQELIVPPLPKALPSRRNFLNRLGLIGMVSTLPIGRFLSSSDAPVLASSESNSNTSSLLRNRAPLAPSAFQFLPLGSIRPAGWLEGQLRIQANGLSGHLDETWADVGPQ